MPLLMLNCMVHLMVEILAVDSIQLAVASMHVSESTVRVMTATLLMMVFPSVLFVG